MPCASRFVASGLTRLLVDSASANRHRHASTMVVLIPRESMQPGFAVVATRVSLTASLLGTEGPGADRLVSTALTETLGVVCLGRLFYRDDLRAQCPGLPATGTAAELILGTYRLKGEAGLEWLEGEFAFVLWKRADGTAVAMRDPVGSYALFWSAEHGRVALATSPSALGRRSGTVLDLDFVADYLTRPTLALGEPADERTAASGVQRVLPGKILNLRPDGSVTARSYWDWTRRIPDPGSRDTKVLAQQMNALLRPAVRERLDEPVASHVSGGMDSSAIAIVAQDWLDARGAGSVQGLSLVYRKLASLTGETRYVDLACGARAGIVPQAIDADDILTYDGFCEEMAFDEPYPVVAGIARDRALLAAAKDAGARTVLSGDGGDDVCEVLPFHIANELRAGRWWSAYRAASARAHAYVTDPWSVLQQYGSEHVLPLSWLTRSRAVALKGSGPASRLPVGPWVRPEFARRYDLAGRRLAQTRRAFRSGGDVAISAALFAIQCKVGDAVRWALASPAGMWLSHPFRDPRLLLFGLGVRQRQYRQDPQLQKPILASAMRGVLPPDIADRRGKSNFNEVYFRGLNRNLATLQRFVARPEIEALGIFDVPALQKAVRTAALGAVWTPHGLLQLDLALSLAYWIATAGTRAAEQASTQERIFVRDTF